MRRFLILGAALVACSNPIFGVGINDVTLSIPAVGYSAGQVIYSSSSSRFNQPTIAFTSVKLRGNSSQTGTALQSVKFFLYARTTAPTGAGCTSSTICSDTSQESFKLNTVELELKLDGSKTAFVVNDPNGKLKDGINAGEMWLGVGITSGFSAASSVKLSELVADVTIL